MMKITETRFKIQALERFEPFGGAFRSSSTMFNSIVNRLEVQCDQPSFILDSAATSWSNVLSLSTASCLTTSLQSVRVKSTKAIKALLIVGAICCKPLLSSLQRASKHLDMGVHLLPTLSSLNLSPPKKIRKKRYLLATRFCFKSITGEQSMAAVASVSFSTAATHSGSTYCKGMGSRARQHSRGSGSDSPFARLLNVGKRPDKRGRGEVIGCMGATT